MLLLLRKRAGAGAVVVDLVRFTAGAHWTRIAISSVSAGVSIGGRPP